MWRRYSQLRQAGILSINQRNSDYVLRYNSRKLYPLVDDKLNKSWHCGPRIICNH